MVVFTCNHCGDSLQKPRVEKHYFTMCRRAKKSLTCVDCLKDFLDEEYVAHTKCVTEQERYAAKGAFTKAVVKKGELKQESWTEVIQSVIESTTRAKPGQQQILTLLSNSPNVPRKKNKFMNFIKSALARKASDQDIEEVWNMIEKYKGSQPTTPASGNENKPEIADENVKTENGNQESVPNNESTVESSKKKKKSKHVEMIKNTEENGDEITMEQPKKKAKTGDVEVNGTAVESTKKKKKSKHVEMNQSSEAVDGNDATTEQPKQKANTAENGIYVAEKIKTELTGGKVNGTAADSSKKKKKSKVIVENSEVLGSTKANGDCGESIEKPQKKKKKSKNLNDNSIVETVDSTTKIEVEMKKEKKKLKTDILAENGEAVDNQISQETKLENDEEKIVNGAAENKKAKKRKLEKLGAGEDQASEKKIKNEIAVNVAEAEAQQQNSDAISCNFAYGEKILEILNTKNSMSLKKLQKKVLDAYQKVTGKEPSKKVLKKFNKHLKSISGVEISENNVRLISS